MRDFDTNRANERLTIKGLCGTARKHLKIWKNDVGGGHQLECVPCSLTRRVARNSLVQSEEERMAKLALVYGMRLVPEEELGEIQDATIVLKNGRTTRVTMHLIEGSKEEIETTFHQSIEAFFDMYPEI